MAGGNHGISQVSRLLASAAPPSALTTSGIGNTGIFDVGLANRAALQHRLRKPWRRLKLALRRYNIGFRQRRAATIWSFANARAAAARLRTPAPQRLNRVRQLPARGGGASACSTRAAIQFFNFGGEQRSASQTRAASALAFTGNTPSLFNSGDASTPVLQPTGGTGGFNRAAWHRLPQHWRYNTGIAAPATLTPGTFITETTAKQGLFCKRRYQEIYEVGLNLVIDMPLP